jgi:hypothetical protein
MVVRSFYAHACQLQFIGQYRRQASRSTTALMWDGLATKRSKARWWPHTRSHLGHPPCRGPGANKTARQPVTISIAVISSLGPYPSCNLNLVVK